MLKYAIEKPIMNEQNDALISTKVDLLIEQVSRDLSSKIADYRNVKIGARILSEKIGVSERTLYRLINKENKPTYQTLFKIYRALFNTSNETLLLELIPRIVREEIEKTNPNKSKKSINFHHDIETEIYYDKCFAEIYFLAACAPVTNELIQFRYGISGMQTLEKMLELKALSLTDKGHYILGENQANFSAKTLKRVGLSLIEKFSKPENAEIYGNNLIGFYAEGLSDEAYDRWLKVDEKAFEEKVNIANEPGAKGLKRSFTFMVTDSLQDK